MYRAIFDFLHFRIDMHIPRVVLFFFFLICLSKILFILKGCYEYHRPGEKVRISTSPFLPFDFVGTCIYLKFIMVSLCFSPEFVLNFSLYLYDFHLNSY